jgi:hypothetical protein
MTGGGGGEKLPKNWTDREKVFNEIIWIMGQKVQCQLLPGRTGAAAGSQTEPVRVEDERVDNDVCVCVGGKGTEQCDGDGDSVGGTGRAGWR